jgi:hypothetical protein
MGDRLASAAFRTRIAGLLFALGALGCYIGGEPPQSCKQETVGETDLMIENQLSTGLVVAMEDAGNFERPHRFVLAPSSCEIHAIPAAEWRVELSRCEWAESGGCTPFGPVLEGDIDIAVGQSRTLEVTPSMFAR